MPSAVILQRIPLRPQTVATAAPDTPPVAGSALWLSTRDLTTLYQSSGGAAAVLDTDPVGQWQDKSGNSRHVAETTNKPVLKLNQVNGLPSVRFDGVNDKLQALFTLNAPFTFFLVLSQLTWTANDVIVGGGAGDNFTFGQYSSSPGIATLWVGNGTTSARDANLPLTTFGIVEVQEGSAGGGKFVKVNNNASTTQTGTDAFDKGGITLGAHPNPSNFGNIDIAEFLLYPSLLSAGQSTSVRDYLNQKFGVF